MDCTNNRLYNSVGWCDGKQVLPGLRKRVFFIPKADVASYPKLPDMSEENTLKTVSTLKDNFVLNADKKWLYLDVLQSKSDISSESQGEYPSISFLNKATFFYADTDEEVTGFCRMAASDDLLFLVQQNNGKFRLIGSELYDRTVVKPSQSSGKGITATDAGTTLEVQASDNCPAPFYVGKIEAEDGDFSGADGGAWTSD